MLLEVSKRIARAEEFPRSKSEANFALPMLDLTSPTYDLVAWTKWRAVIYAMALKSIHSLWISLLSYPVLSYVSEQI